MASYILPECEMPQSLGFVPETPCTYLPDKTEALVVAVAPRGFRIGPKAAEYLSKLGFRRSAQYLYFPYCPSCGQCKSCRVLVNSFQPTRTQAKTYRRNSDLTQRIVDLQFRQEHYDLFVKYLNVRHKGGEMCGMTPEDYRTAMLVSPSDSRIIEHRDANGKLAIVSITDFFTDGLSAHYTFYDPDRLRTSPGTFAILFQIDLARRLGMPHLYLGFWIKDCRNMAYKSRFRPLEIYNDGKWILADNFDSSENLEAS
ncbi:MAG: arginyltransferase [Burkholderiales bacterium]|nr:arginyltransferase [Burkholderiales bacterium]